ncbi:MAG: MmcB family DNA repair protein [Pseudomonadota bacterium]
METFHEQKAPSGAAPAARPDITQALTQGVVRLFLDLGLSPLTEFRLPSGRRVDVAGLDSKGRLAFAEIKSGVEDFEADQKWPDYLGYCDAFYFAVSRDFPQTLLPASEGVILADQFGGAVVRGPASRSMAPARRKSIMLRFARVAAGRLWTA